MNGLYAYILNTLKLLHASYGKQTIIYQNVTGVTHLRFSQQQQKKKNK